MKTSDIKKLSDLQLNKLKNEIACEETLRAKKKQKISLPTTVINSVKKKAKDFIKAMDKINNTEVKITNYVNPIVGCVGGEFDVVCEVIYPDDAIHSNSNFQNSLVKLEEMHVDFRNHLDNIAKEYEVDKQALRDEYLGLLDY